MFTSSIHERRIRRFDVLVLLCMCVKDMYQKSAMHVVQNCCFAHKASFFWRCGRPGGKVAKTLSTNKFTFLIDELHYV